MSHRTSQPNLADFGDSLGAAIVQHIDLSFRKLLGTGPGRFSEEKFIRLQTGEAHPFANMVLLGNGIDAATAYRAIAPLAECNAMASAWLIGAPTAELEQVLSNHGFAPGEALPAMAVEINGLAATSLPEGYSLVRLGPDANQAQAWKETFASGFGLTSAAAEPFKPQISATDRHADLQYFAIIKDDTQQIVATSAICLHDGLAGIYCVATLPSERRKGLGAHATAEPLRKAHEQGYRIGILHASTDGFPVYAKLGFREYAKALIYLRGVSHS